MVSPSRSRRPALALLALSALLGCEPEPERETWRIRAYPSVCEDALEGHLCPIYEHVDGTDIGDFDYLEGFTPAWGLTREIEVERREHDPDSETPINSPIYYVLIEILSEAPAPALEFDITLPIASVDVASGTGEVGPDLPFVCAPASCEALAAVLAQGWTVASETSARFRFGPSEALLPVELVSVGE